MKRLLAAALLLFSASIFAEFDRTDPADLLALQTEVNTDPISMGYASANNTTQLLSLLNDPTNNVGGETVSRTFDVSAMLDALDPVDYESPQATAHATDYTLMLINCACDITGYKTIWRAQFAGNSATVAALDAQVRALSRAEVLFGDGTTISRDDWFAARDYTP